MAYSLRKLLEVQRGLSDSLLPLPICTSHGDQSTYLYKGKQTDRKFSEIIHLLKYYESWPGAELKLMWSQIPHEDHGVVQKLCVINLINITAVWTQHEFLGVLGGRHYWLSSSERDIQAVNLDTVYLCKTLCNIIILSSCQKEAVLSQGRTVTSLFSAISNK